LQKFLAGIVMMLAGVGTSSCQSPPEMDVERQWADTMRRLNMFGFYPPTEDVQVGDIYLHVPPAGGGPSLPRFSLVRVASYSKADLLRELTAQQIDDRLAIQPLPGPKAGSNAADAPAPVTAADGTTGCGDYQIGHADQDKCRLRLRRSAIPALTVGRVTSAQLGAAGLLGNVGARLGLGSSTETAVHVYVSNIQELVLDAWRFSHMQERGSRRVDGRIWAEDLISALGQMRPDLALPACKGDVSRLQRNGVTVEVINRVVYAGAVEYSFTHNAETAVRLALDLEAAGGQGKPKIPSLPASQGGGVGNNNAGNAGSAEDATAAAKASGARLAGLLGSLSGETGSTEPRAGINSSFGVGTFGNMALKVNFNRPIAVGAGSRVRYSFYDWANGTNDGYFDYKLAGAAQYCRSAFPMEFDASALKGLMNAFGCNVPVSTTEQRKRNEHCQCVEKNFAEGKDSLRVCP
jgi:hypothetical protein